MNNEITKEIAQGIYDDLRELYGLLKDKMSAVNDVIALEETLKHHPSYGGQIMVNGFAVSDIASGIFEVKGVLVVEINSWSEKLEYISFNKHPQTIRFDLYEDPDDEYPMAEDISIPFSYLEDDDFDKFYKAVRASLCNVEEIKAEANKVEATKYVLVNLLRNFDIEEITLHLSANGYNFIRHNDSLFIWDEEIAYLETILKDRGVDYEIDN